MVAVAHKIMERARVAALPTPPPEQGAARA